MRHKLRSIFFDPVRIAEVLRDELQRSVKGKGSATIAIPGGRSPGSILTALASIMPEDVRCNLHLLWVDERAVPVGDKDRNDAATLAAWQEGGPLPPGIHPMPAEYQILEKAAAEYEKTIEEVTGDGKMDICLLGVGEDGHIASLFPDHPALNSSEEVLPIYDSPKPPVRRLTLSLPVINRARLRIVLAPGEEKDSVFQRASLGPDLSLPASLLPAEGTIWFVDHPGLSR